MKLKQKLIAFAIICTLSFLLSCSFPGEEQVKNDFRLENPAFKPISAIVGEGDGDAGNYHIRYKKPDDEKTYEQTWLYLRQDDGKFKVTSKGREKVID